MEGGKGGHLQLGGQVLCGGAEHAISHGFQVTPVQGGAHRTPPHAPVIAAADCKAVPKQELRHLRWCRALSHTHAMHEPAGDPAFSTDPMRVMHVGATCSSRLSWDAEVGLSAPLTCTGKPSSLRVQRKYP